MCNIFMKKSFIVILSLILFTFSAFAKEVTEDTAIRKASELMSVRQTNFSGRVSCIQLVYASGNPVYYIIHFAPEGWVMVSAQDITKPIIGYSETGSFEKNNQPESMRSWFQHIEEEIVDAVKNNSKTHPEWEIADTGNPLRIKRSPASEPVEPLIKVKFNQSRPFNTFCPSDNNGTSLVGCVAVAMAQAMTVSRHPVKPNGSYSFFHNTYGNIYVNYDEQAPYNWDLIISGTDGKQEAARLLYHCGVSVRMDYGVTGSGTQTTYVVNALKNFYSYAPSVKIYPRNTYQGDWEELLLNELNAGRPVVYSGNNGGVGHAFNLDGHDGNYMYHVNWGWGGANNGYYTIDGMKDGDQIYTQNQQMIVGIRPPSEAPSDILLSNMTIQEGKEIGTIVGDVTVESEATNPEYIYELKGHYSVIFHDYMPAQFYIENGKLKTKAVFDFADGDQSVIIKATNTKNKLSYEREFIIKVTENGTSVDNTTFTKPKIYQNSKNSIGVDSDEPLFYEIYSVLGTRLTHGMLKSGNSTIELMGYNQSIVLLKVSTKNQNSGTYKIILK